MAFPGAESADKGARDEVIAASTTVDTGFTLVGSWSAGTAVTSRLECAVSSGTMSVSSGTLYAIQVSSVTLVGSRGSE